MIKGRRIGTLTAGGCMVIFGVLFLVHMIIPALTFRLIAAFWPIVLIFLGIEVLAAYVLSKGEKPQYDVGAVLLLIALSFFTVFMAIMQVCADHSFYLSL